MNIGDKKKAKIGNIQDQNKNWFLIKLDILPHPFMQKPALQPSVVF